VARTKTETYAITTTGVGRVDYSQDVQKSVEPITTSWQSQYKEYDQFSVLGLSTVTRDYLLNQGYVVMVYDYYLSSPSNVAIELAVDMYSALGNWLEIAHKIANQYVDLNIAKGWPFFNKWRIRVINANVLPIDCYFSAHGITTTETEYYGTGVPGIP
jgi:hypothetical protein